MTQVQVAKLVAVLMGAFGSAKTTPMTSGIYERMLLDLDHERAEAAVMRLLATSEFMPTIAAIRAAALDVDERAAGTRRTGMEAWERAMKAVSRFGFYRMEEGMASIDDEHILSTVRAIGWRVLCNVDETDPSVRARFIDSYNQLAARARKDAQSSPGAHAPARLALVSPADQPRIETTAPSTLTDDDRAEIRAMIASVAGWK